VIRALVCIGVAVASLPQAVADEQQCPQGPSGIVIFSGGVGGVYHGLATELGRILAAQTGAKVDVHATAGSGDNLLRLLESTTKNARPCDIMLGLIQRSHLEAHQVFPGSRAMVERLLLGLGGLKPEVRDEALRGAAQTIKQLGHRDVLRVLARLYDEPLHILARRSVFTDSTLEEGGPIQAAHACLGPIRSGTARDAVAVLEHLGLAIDPNRHHFTESMTECLDRFSSDGPEGVHLVFLTSGVPSPMVQARISDWSQVRFLSLPGTLTRELRDAESRPVTNIIKEGTYTPEGHPRPIPDHDVTTLVDTALLVGTKSLPTELADLVLDAWFNDIAAHNSKIRAALAVDDAHTPIALLEPTAALAPFAGDSEHLRLHPAASSYYKSLDMWTRLETYRENIVFAFALLLLMGCASALQRSRIASMDYSRLLMLTIFLAAVWLIGAFCMLQFERDSPYFSTLGQAGWSIATYLFSGLEDKEPTTPQGRVTAIAMMIGGIVVIADFTGELASILTSRRLRERPLPRRRLREHLVVCFFGEDGADLLIRLGESGAVAGRTTVVLSEDVVDIHELRKNSRLRPFLHTTFFTRGDPTSVAELRRVKVGRAAHVVVLAKPHETRESLMTVLALKELFVDAPGSRKVDVTIETSDARIGSPPRPTESRWSRFYRRWRVFERRLPGAAARAAVRQRIWSYLGHGALPVTVLVDDPRELAPVSWAASGTGKELAYAPSHRGLTTTSSVSAIATIGGSADTSLRVEPIEPSTFALGVLAQATMSPGMAEVYDTLVRSQGGRARFFHLSHTPHHDGRPAEIGPKTWRNRLVGRTFAEVSLFFLDGYPDHGATLVGVVRRGHVHLNPLPSPAPPASGAFDAIEDGDRLLVFARELPFFVD